MSGPSTLGTMTGGVAVPYPRGVSTVAAPSTSSRALWLRDAATTVVLGAVMIGGIYGAARHHNEHVFRRPDAAAVVLLVAIVAALLLRRRYPVAVLGAVWALTLVYFAAGYPDGPIWLGQAGVALHVNGVLPEQARTALAAIKDASREALGELRSALDVLRQSGDAPPRRPAPGLADLPDLVAGARTAGLDVRVETEGAPVAVPAPLDLAAYRVAQEALTNVIRHAAATTVWLRLTYAASELRLRIEDDGRGPAVGEPAGGGSGIAGMRERAAALGGELRTGRRPGGGFQVSARFALPASTESEP